MKTYTFWLFGLPSSGKTTLASLLCDKYDLVHLDSDEMRKFLTPNPTFLQNEREIVYRSMIHSCYLLNNNGKNVIVSATANLEKYRTLADEMLENIKKIYIKCPLEICEQRDVKGLYKKSMEGLITTVPIKIIGENDRYVYEKYKETDIFEAPTKSDLIINTAELDIESSIIKLSEYIGNLI
ncbi:MAG: adenylyl-sulfate kinase [Oscillospiraceae bacterium]|nr:adenylyl-sulfate kinase [Oscillospiraceae bacterium]